MINIKIGVEDTGELTPEKSNGNRLELMNAAMNAICEYLSRSNNTFEEKAFCQELVKYIEQYDRILYSILSDKIFAYNKTGQNEKISSMLANIEILSEYVFDEQFKSDFTDGKKRKDIQKIVIKLSDHINLANKQFESLKQSDNEYKERFENSIEPVINSMQKEMSSQLLSMIGMFTALSFLIFGGISSLDNNFNQLDKPIFKLIVVGSVWSIGILNLVFVFLFCISKMTDLSFKSTNKLNASLFRKYPVVAWSNYFMFCVLFIGLIGYFITQNGYSRLVVLWVNKHLCASLGIVAGVVVAIIILGVMIHNITKNKDE